MFSGRYPVGYDLLAGYAPAISSFPDVSALSLFGWQWSPLAVIVLWSIKEVGVPTYTLLKFAGPIFYGSLISGSYYAMRKGLGWTDRKSILAAALLMIEPALLRIGWDQLRLELGLTLFFVLLASTKGNLLSGPLRKQLLTLTLSLLIALSSQLATVLLLVVVLWQAILAIARNRTEALKSLFPFVPVGIFFVIGVYMTYYVNSYNPHLTPIGSPSGTQVFGFENYLHADSTFLGGNYLAVLTYVLSLSAFSIFPLIPLSIQGAFAHKLLAPMTLWLVVASYSVAVFPWFSFAFFWWWTIILAIPLTIFAIEGLDRHSCLTGKRLRFTLVGLLFLLVIAIGYSASLINIGNQYTYPFLPSGLVQSSVPFNDIPDIEHAFAWANSTLPSSATVIVPEQFQGFASSYLRSDLKVRVAPASFTLDQARTYDSDQGQQFGIYYSNKIGGTAQYTILMWFGPVTVSELN